MKTRNIHLGARLWRIAFRSVALTSILTLTMAAAALAQEQPRSHNSSTIWFGGNQLSQKNQPPPAISDGNAELMNQGDWDDDDQAHYKVIRIGVLPGKTASFLPIVRSVNNREHVTGYSFIAADFFRLKEL